MEIINGLHVDVPGAELKELMAARLKHHQEKAEFYEVQHKKMAEVDAEMAKEAAIHSKISNSAAETIESALKRHQNNIIYYKFMVNHVNVGAIYRLTENELQRLGIQSSYY